MAWVCCDSGESVCKAARASKLPISRNAAVVESHDELQMPAACRQQGDFHIAVIASSRATSNFDKVGTESMQPAVTPTVSGLTATSTFTGSSDKALTDSSSARPTSSSSPFQMLWPASYASPSPEYTGNSRPSTASGDDGAELEEMEREETDTVGDLLLAGMPTDNDSESEVCRSARWMQPETTPATFMELWSSARFHRAADELSFGPHIVVPPNAGHEVQAALDMAAHLDKVFAEMRREIPEMEKSGNPISPSSHLSPSSASRPVTPSSSAPLRRVQSKLNTQPISSIWLSTQGFEDVSPPENKQGERETFAWLKVEPQRTFCSMEVLDLPFSVEELLPVLCEFEQFPVWFPFMKSAQVLHDFEGTAQHIRMGRASVSLPMLSLEAITICCIEDRLRDCGCIGVYVFSPPDDVTMSKSGGQWMGASVPGLPASKFQVRLPFAWARTCLFPLSRTRTRIRAEVAVVNVVPPIHWVFRHAAHELAKRVPGMLAKMIHESKTNEIGKASAKRPEFYESWASRLNTFYARQSM
mmetsp:Transcript_19442/g.45197  ORF Transcript_19442/g.45197 Transcript_19442/m.45197 type:complete len:530 (+) Transcript_19442:31-1620(+)